MSITIGQESPSLLSQAKDIATVMIAMANFGLAFYILLYQKRKDKTQAQKDAENILRAAQLNEQNIKLQWFKELVVQPRIKDIDAFYTLLHSIRDKITSNDLSEDEKQHINSFVKAQQRKFRKAFIDVLHDIEKQFANETQAQVDELVDNITEAIFDDELKLNNEVTFEKYVSSKIDQSHNKLIAQIYSYKGV